MNIKKNDLREFSVNDSYFDMLTPQSCWLLGLLASDGNITKDRFIKISQSGKEGLNNIELNINKLKKSDFLHEFRLNGEKAYLFGKYLYNDINKVNIYKSYKYKKFINFEQKYIQKTKWYRYQQLYKQLKEDLTNNNFINNTRWGKLHNAGHNWIIKNKKIILKELQNEI